MPKINLKVLLFSGLLVSTQILASSAQECGSPLPDDPRLLIDTRDNLTRQTAMVLASIEDARYSNNTDEASRLEEFNKKLILDIKELNTRIYNHFASQGRFVTPTSAPQPDSVEYCDNEKHYWPVVKMEGPLEWYKSRAIKVGGDWVSDGLRKQLAYMDAQEISYTTQVELVHEVCANLDFPEYWLEHRPRTGLENDLARAATNYMEEHVTMHHYDQKISFGIQLYTLIGSYFVHSRGTWLNLTEAESLLQKIVKVYDAEEYRAIYQGGWRYTTPSDKHHAPPGFQLPDRNWL